MKKQKLIVAAVLICGIILCIWGANMLHNSSKQEETVSSEGSSTTSTTAYQTETTTQTTTQADTEEAYFEEDTEEEVQIENAVKELVKDAGKTSPEGEKAVQCYIRFLQDNYAKYYDIADIDGDGIPEFFVLNPNSSAAMYRYNAKKDKVKKLHSYQLGRASVMYYSKEKHQVVFVTADTGGGQFDTHEYTDGELNKIETLVFHNGKHDEEGYLYNGEKISMEEGDNYIENLREHYQSLRGKGRK